LEEHTASILRVKDYVPPKLGKLLSDYHLTSQENNNLLFNMDSVNTENGPLYNMGLQDLSMGEHCTCADSMLN
jgi:hypothetical protein